MATEISAERQQMCMKIWRLCSTTLLKTANIQMDLAMYHKLIQVAVSLRKCYYSHSKLLHVFKQSEARADTVLSLIQMPEIIKIRVQKERMRPKYLRYPTLSG